MATINLTFTTNANQDAALTHLLNTKNAERAAQVPPLSPYANVTAMLTDVITDWFQGYRRNYIQARKDAINTAVETATNAQINNVATALGITIP